MIIETWFEQDLMKPVQVQYINGNVFSQDNMGNRIGVKLYKDGVAHGSEGTISASVIRADGATLAVTGSSSGNTAWVDLPQAAYAVPGLITIVIKSTVSSAVTTICAALATVYRSSTDSIVDPGTIIPSIADLIAQIQAAVASIPADYSSLWTSLAPAYSTSSAYTVGDYVTYDGGLYRCVTEITAGETWTAGKWKQIAAGTGIFDLSQRFGGFINATFTRGKNLFNRNNAEMGYLLRNDGTLRTSSSGYISEYIPVEAEKTYNIRWAVKSSSYANVCYYDASKAYLSSYGGSSSNPYFTTPAGCAFVRINGSTTDNRLYTQMLNEGDTFTEFEPYANILLPNCGGADECCFMSAFPIGFSRETSKLFLINQAEGEGTIYLHIPGMELISFTNPITVSGSGNIISYDIDTNAFSLIPETDPYSPNVYRIGNKDSFMAAKDLKTDNDQLFIVGNTQPVIVFDLIMRTAIITVPSSTFIWYKKTYSSIPTGSYTLDLGTKPNHFLIHFDVYAKDFQISTSYNGKKTSPSIIPIADVYGSNIQSVIPYEVKSVSPKLSKKTIVTYGDSLTWYDGNAFTWGPHEGETCYGYQSYLRGYLGADVTNRGQSGKTTPQIMSRIMADETNITGKDYVIFMPSIMNDDRIGVSPGTVQPIGGTFDTTTTAGAMQEAIEYIYSLNPGVRIVIMVEPMGFTYEGRTQPELCNPNLPVTIRSVANLYGLPIIDLWNNSGINELTRNVFYADPTFESGNTHYMYHPNNLGWERLSRIICEEMAKF